MNLNCNYLRALAAQPPNVGFLSQYFSHFALLQGSKLNLLFCSLYATFKVVEVKARQLRIYAIENGKKPFDEWLKELKDPPTIRRIQARLAGVIAGNLGDVKTVGDGVSELRFAFGAGYRIYFSTDGEELVILLSGGDKSSQDRDIRKAKEYLVDYRRQNYEQR